MPNKKPFISFSDSHILWEGAYLFMNEQNPNKLENEGIIKTVIILASVSLLLVLGAPQARRSEPRVYPNNLHQTNLGDAAKLNPLGNRSSFEP